MDFILDTFYKEIITEASEGRVEAFFPHNILFTTSLEGKIITTSSLDQLFVPTLVINNKKKFDELLVSYVFLTSRFYNYNILNKDILKSILALLWSNATEEDFLNPTMYIEKRISFMTDPILANETTLSYDTSIGNLTIINKKASHGCETPFYLDISINDNELPSVYLGIYNNKGYIYAIQNKAKEKRDKKLNRDLYKVNEGIDLSLEESDNILSPENLKGITPSTLISALVAISYLKRNNIERIVVPTFLVERWNAKEIANVNKNSFFEIFDLESESKIHEDIQRNLSDKYIRTFRRLEYHFSNINIDALPYVDSNNLLISIDDEVNCNNPLLKEIYSLINSDNLTR